jgi:Raf kinase inhibitor-like YbhB/YbcL family protein
MNDHPNTLGLTSPAFSEGFAVPQDCTADGRNVSPPLAWRDPPAGTVSFALICEDPDAPRGTWTHWVLFNLPADVRELPPGVPLTPTLATGARQGTNSFGRIGYGGPSPPPGPAHRYVFKLYALSGKLPLDTGATREQVLEAMRGLHLAEGRLIGVYGRAPR